MATAYLGLTYETSTPKQLVEAVHEWKRIEWERDKQRAIMFGLAQSGQEIPDFPEDSSAGSFEASSFFL